MVALSESLDRPDFSDGAIVPVRYEPEISLTESWGGKARQLWEERFKECAEYAQDSELLFTGIGGAPGGNDIVPVRVFETGTMVAPVVQLKEHFGRVPKMLFLSASCVNGDQLIALRGLARSYKEQGVEKIVVILSAFPHERQDDVFINKDTKEVIYEPIALKDTLEILADRGYVDGGIMIQPHSMKLIEYALDINFPMLPFDAFPLLIQRAQLYKIKNPFTLGPDTGRNEEAKAAASFLHCRFGSAHKTRDRLRFGIPRMDIPQETLDYIKEHDCTVLTFDDEIRTGETIEGLAEALKGYVTQENGLNIFAIKGICVANMHDHVTAVQHLRNRLITRVVMTDAVRPWIKMKSIEHKLERILLQGDIIHLVSYLKRNFIPDNNPNWLKEPEETGTLMQLDIRMTTIHKETPS